jgi:hypothetical protein
MTQTHIAALQRRRCFSLFWSMVSLFMIPPLLCPCRDPMALPSRWGRRGPPNLLPGAQQSRVSRSTAPAYPPLPCFIHNLGLQPPLQLRHYVVLHPRLPISGSCKVAWEHEHGYFFVFLMPCSPAALMFLLSALPECLSLRDS